MSRNKGVLNTKNHLAVDSHGMPVRIIITDGTTNDSKMAKALVKEIPAEYLFANKAMRCKLFYRFLN